MKNNCSKFDNITRELRLLYYNNYLLENGVITKHEHEKMNLVIISKYGKRHHNELHNVS